MTTIDGAPFVDTPVNDIIFKFPAVERNLPKDLTKTKNSCDNVLNLFQDAKHNRDLFDKTISLVTDGKSILLEIESDAQKIEDSPIFRKFSDCISRLETFNQSNSTDVVRQGISKLNDELEASINGLNKLLDESKSGNEHTRWNGKVKKKFKAFGKMVMIRKSILPPERGFSVYDVSRMVEPIKPPIFYGSKKHITKGLYAVTTYVSLKEIGDFEKGDQKLIELTKEMDFIKSLECRNVLEIYGIHRQGIKYNVVSRWEEYNLQTYLLESFPYIDWTKKLTISRGIADGLNFIHQKGILHYDIKSHNIYLNSYFEAKLHNFRIVKDSPIILTSANEPTDLRWSPPERLRGGEYTKASDIYSFSLVLWEIVNQQIPYHDTSPDDIKKLVLIGTHPNPKETDGTPVEYQDIMEKGWNVIPNQRPTIEEMFDVLTKLEIAEKCHRRISRIGDDINTSNNLLSPNSAIKDGNGDDAASIISINSVGSVDFVSPSGYNVTTHLGKRKGIVKFNPFHKSTVDFEEAVRLHKDGNYNQAWKIIKEVKKRVQTPDANFWVGYYYVKGFHKQKGKSNPNLGVEYLWKAAKEDHADAQYHYANAILNLGCVAEEHRNEKRFKIAMELLEKAAKQDHSLALKKLGSIRKRGLYGKGVDINAGKDMIKRGRAMTLQNPQVDRPRSSLHEARPTNRLVRHSTATS